MRCRPFGLLAFLVLTTFRVEGRADLRCAAPMVDAGEVRSGLPLAREYRLVNEGPEAVELVAVQPSCGCLRPGLEQKSLRPGEACSLVLEANTLGQPAGPHTWQVRVQYRRGETLQDLLLQLNARVVTEITVRPAAVTCFAQGALAQEVVLTDTRPRPLEVKEVRTTSLHLRAALVEGQRDPAGPRTFRVRLEVLPDFPPGRHEEVLTLYTDDLLYQHLQVPVTVVRTRGQRLAVTPQEVSAAAAPGQPVPARLLLVRDNRDEAVAVKQVTADDPAVQCRWAEGPGNLATVRVQIDRTRVSGPVLRTAVHIHVGRPVPETLSVPVQCTLE